MRDFHSGHTRKGMEQRQISGSRLDGRLRLSPFSSSALKWHSFLPLDVRNNWYKLEMALIEQWGTPDDRETQEK